MINKKQIEREILTSVYAEKEYYEIIASERPDFLIKHNEKELPFGVEITEFYFSESNARIRNIPDYFNEILEKNDYRHKSDKKILQVVEFNILEQDGTLKGKAEGIFQETPTVEDYTNLIIEQIKKKTTLLENYSTKISHTNLIIFDTECRLNTIPTNHFYRYFFTDSIKQILYDTNFREIFLITKLENNVYIPLKMMMLPANFHLFHKITFEFLKGKYIQFDIEEFFKKENINAFMLVFAKYMKIKTSDVFVNRINEEIRVIFGNTGIGLEGNKINLYDYKDYPRPAHAKKIQEDALVSYFTSSEFVEAEQEVLKKYVFSAGLAFDVKNKLEY